LEQIITIKKRFIIFKGDLFLMQLHNVTFSFSKPDSSLFSRILDFRFKSFFEPFQLDRSNVSDGLDEVSIHIVAQQEHAIIGYSRITLGTNEAQISQMVVDLPFRRKGLGRELLERSMERVKEAGIKKVYINSRLNALKFYEKMGFKSVGEVFASKKNGLLHMRMEKTI
jgi:predicted GNAT family N-acyltransferase